VEHPESWKGFDLAGGVSACVALAVIVFGQVSDGLGHVLYELLLGLKSCFREYGL
jgi:hypothetical protein